MCYSLRIVVLLALMLSPFSIMSQSMVGAEIFTQGNGLYENITVLGFGIPKSLSWKADGGTVAISTSIGLRIFRGDLQSEGVLMEGHPFNTSSLTWSPDGSKLASARENKAYIWDLNSSSLLTLEGHTSNVSSTTWSPNSQFLATGGWDNNIYIWDASDGHVIDTLTGHEGFVNSVDWSPDGSKVISASVDGTVRIWNSSSGDELDRIHGFAGSVADVEWSPSGNLVAVGTSFEGVSIWDMSNLNEPARKFDTQYGVIALNWKHDGSQIATSNTNNTITIWNVNTGILEQTIQDSASAFEVDWRPNFSQISSISGNRLHLWSSTSGLEEIVNAFEGYTSSMNYVSWKPDNTHIAGNSHELTIWNVQSENVVEVIQTNAILVAISPDWQYLAKLAADETVAIIDLTTGNQADLQGHTRRIKALAWNSNGTLLASASLDGTVKIWQVNGTLMKTLQATGEYDLTSLTWSPDDSQIAAGSHDGSLHLWNINTEAYVRMQLHTNVIEAVAWSPDGVYLATGNRDNTITIWDFSTNQIKHTLSGHTERILSLSWNPTDDEVVSGSQDDTVRVWNTETGQLMATIQGHVADVAAVSWSFDGSRIASASLDGTVRIWEVVAQPACDAGFQVAVGDIISLISAIDTANGNPEADVIGLEAGTYTFTTAYIPLNALPAITSEITIIGNGATLTRQAGAPLFGFFEVSAGGNLTLENLTLNGGDVGNDTGGALVNEGGTVTLNNVTFSNNHANTGGAIYNAAGAVLTVTDDSQIFQNTALGKGGGIYDEAQSGTADHKIEGSCIFNNAAPLGAAIVTDFLEMENNAYTLPGQATPEAKDRIQADSNLVMTLGGASIPITSGNPSCAGTTPPALENSMPAACHVRPLLFSLNAVLYAGEQGDGRTQVLKDMRSVIDPTSPAEGGLLGHYGPTINSPVNRGDDLVNHPFHEDRERLTWNTQHVPVLYRVQYPPDTDDPDQIWYYVAFDELFTPPGTSIALSGVWIAVRMNDPVEAAQDRFYIEGVGVEGSAYPYISGVTPSDTDPCKGYIPTVNDPNDPEYDPDFTFTFYYDREVVAAYGIAQAQANDATDGVPGQHNVTTQVSDQPFTDFSYQQVDNTNIQVGGTGSSPFVSEVLWVGGLPATWSFVSQWDPVSNCTANGANNLKGWRYCPPTSGPNGAGSEVWTQHEEIVGYYVADPNHSKGWITLYTDTNMQSAITRASDVIKLQNDGTYNFNSQGRQVFDPADSTKYWFSRDDIVTYFGDQQVNIDNGDVTDRLRVDFYNNWILTRLTGIQSGDYIYVNSIVTSANNPGDTHGFVVIGWGPILDCEDTINTTFTFQTSNAGDGTDYLNTIFPNSSSAYGYDVSGSLTVNVFGSIPYVVDFSGTSHNLRRQTPKPRPFYCSAYNDLTTVGDPNTQGQQENYFGRDHEWFFFTMPNDITIPSDRIFVSIP